MCSDTTGRYALSLPNLPHAYALDHGSDFIELDRNFATYRATSGELFIVHRTETKTHAVPLMLGEAKTTNLLETPTPGRITISQEPLLLLDLEGAIIPTQVTYHAAFQIYVGILVLLLVSPRWECVQLYLLQVGRGMEGFYIERHRKLDSSRIPLFHVNDALQVESRIILGGISELISIQFEVSNTSSEERVLDQITYEIDTLRMRRCLYKYRLAVGFIERAWKINREFQESGSLHISQLSRDLLPVLRNPTPDDTTDEGDSGIFGSYLPGINTDAMIHSIPSPRSSLLCDDCEDFIDEEICWEPIRTSRGIQVWIRRVPTLPPGFVEFGTPLHEDELVPGRRYFVVDGKYYGFLQVKAVDPYDPSDRGRYQDVTLTSTGTCGLACTSPGQTQRVQQHSELTPLHPQGRSASSVARVELPCLLLVGGISSGSDGRLKGRACILACPFTGEKLLHRIILRGCRLTTHWDVLYASRTVLIAVGGGNEKHTYLQRIDLKTGECKVMVLEIGRRNRPSISFGAESLHIESGYNDSLLFRDTVSVKRTTFLSAPQ
ncbi:hypothetical protein GMRT_10105 [Giardia muris]|uniref:Uncharacterized protein n=1 Tax=Giardia muris TaxID=5742 RepID=A0A4Z1SRZ0_GIAMU|nr:hypothetical protein GMRT_10105 [Giardia muris]|eukprot:TNJ27755.1 hypothetical protein GMRT_10105 [Giardia muris]